ncbi:MAG: hypothetical protein DMG42_13180 [Acidobacteria bacterium]|nr:MAG: hypothetical protein DMG42_13180 [Acidobacteriota bacterium]
MKQEAFARRPADALFQLPCACQNLRRLTRIVTRIYDRELRKAGIEITQFGLLTALAIAGEANQKTLSAGFAMDSTIRLTEAGKRQTAAAQRHWEAAERRLRKTLGPSGWKQMQTTVAQVTNAAAEA